VGKGAASQLKPWEWFVGRALVQILEEMEEEREAGGPVWLSLSHSGRHIRVIHVSVYDVYDIY